MITTPEKIREYRRQKARNFRQRHGDAWRAYNRDWMQRQRRDARLAAGRALTPHDLALPTHPLKCPSAR